MNINNNNSSAVSGLNLKCCVCHQVPVDVVDSSCCSSLFCWECGTAVDKCPNCASPIKWEGLHANPALQKIIDNMQLQCRFEGCEVKVVSALRKEHESLCEYRPCTCPNNDLCGIILSKDLSKHLENDCPERSMQCPYNCGQSVKLSAMLEHVKSTCDAMEVNCSQGCGTKMKKKDLLVHLNDECDLTAIPCEFSQYGCPSVLLRSEYKEHLDANLHKHMSFLTSVVKLHEDEIKTLKSQLESSKTFNLPDLTNQIAQAHAAVHSAAHQGILFAHAKSGVAIPFAKNLVSQVKQNYNWSAFGTFMLLIFLYSFILPKFMAFITLIYAVASLPRAIYNSDGKKIIHYGHYLLAAKCGMGCCFVCPLVIAAIVGLVYVFGSRHCAGFNNRCRRMRCL